MCPHTTNISISASLPGNTTTQVPILTGACGKVAIDLGLGGGFCRRPCFLHHFQLASHDLTVIWQKRRCQTKFRIQWPDEEKGTTNEVPYSKISYKVCDRINTSIFEQKIYVMRRGRTQQGPLHPIKHFSKHCIPTVDWSRMRNKVWALWWKNAKR